jgi:hypothetical protein
MTGLARVIRSVSELLIRIFDVTTARAGLKSREIL